MYEEDNQRVMSVKDDNQSVMSVKDWLVTLLIMCVPLVNFVMIFVWAFGNGNENRSNFYKAVLILYGIIIALAFALGLIGGIIGAFAGSM